VRRGGGARRCARGQAQVNAGRVGHGQAVGDPLEDVELFDLLDAPDDVAHCALAEDAGDADLGLAGTCVLVQEGEEPAHIAAAKRGRRVDPLPEAIRDRD
jgi:hypothetical protein